jgi:hypothetical protein
MKAPLPETWSRCENIIKIYLRKLGYELGLSAQDWAIF